MHLFTSTNDDYCDAPMREFPAPIRALVWVVMGILWVFSKLMWRWNTEDARYLEPAGKTGNVIICNHTSMAEVVAIEAQLFFMGRRVRPIYKSEFARTRIVAWAFSRTGGIPVERGTADMRALRCAQHALKRGEDVLIFPEGTRVRTDDQVAPVHGGFAVMAQMGKAPVVPMAVCGYRDITPVGKKLMRPVKCWQRVGEPLSLADAPVGLGRKERLAWLETESWNRVIALRDALRAEHPGRR